MSDRHERGHRRHTAPQPLLSVDHCVWLWYAPPRPHRPLIAGILAAFPVARVAWFCTQARGTRGFGKRPRHGELVRWLAEVGNMSRLSDDVGDDEHASPDGGARDANDGEFSPPTSRG